MLEADELQDTAEELDALSSVVPTEYRSSHFLELN